MGQVIKRGGKKRQVFNSAKIRKSIQKAAKDVKFSPTKIKELVKEVSNAVIKQYKGKRVVKSIVLRKSILGRLDRRVKSIASAWKRYEKRRKR